MARARAGAGGGALYTITCELEIPRPDGADVDLELVNVIHSPNGGAPALVHQDNRAPCAAGADGWQYSDDLSKIVLCGAICDAVRADEGGRVDVVLGCPVQGPD